MLFCEIIDDLSDNFGTNWKLVFSFTPWPLYSMEGTPGTHGIGGWVGARAGLDVWEKREISYRLLSGHSRRNYLLHRAESFLRS